VIINMSSVAGRFGYPNRSPYATTKWGLIGFTKTLSIELGALGIRANAIPPGAVEGPRIEKVLEGRAKLSGQSVEEVKEEAMSIQSLKRFVDARDIASLAVFLPPTPLSRSPVRCCRLTMTCRKQLEWFRGAFFRPPPRECALLGSLRRS
jgi:NAD(P)-dependent dehydrogenase (short-subunit alcohol dehydrogenase family)